jgi:hypothetical protein
MLVLTCCVSLDIDMFSNFHLSSGFHDEVTFSLNIFFLSFVGDFSCSNLKSRLWLRTPEANCSVFSK